MHNKLKKVKKSMLLLRVTFLMKHQINSKNFTIEKFIVLLFVIEYK